MKMKVRRCKCKMLVLVLVLVLVFGSDQFSLVCFVQTDLARCQVGVESIGVGVKCLVFG